MSPPDDLFSQKMNIVNDNGIRSFAKSFFGLSTGFPTRYCYVNVNSWQENGVFI